MGVAEGGGGGEVRGKDAEEEKGGPKVAGEDK